MKCPSCGAEIGNNKTCDYCGSQISIEMKKEQEQINKQGCPKCGSSNIKFNRENQGEIQGERGRQIVNRTVGFCQDCGHTWYPNSPDNEAPKKNNTIWWVLGWLFFFPAPIMVLIWRKKNTWDLKIKIAVTAIFWIVILVMGSTNKDTATTDTSSQAEKDISSTESEKTVTESVQSDNEVKIVDDEVVNAFVIRYNDISESPLVDLTKGNIRTKYFAYSYGYYLELLNSNATNKIVVTINETNDNADDGVAGMKTVFHDIVKTIDESLTDDEIYSYFDGMILSGIQSESNLGTTDVFYSPDVELSKGHSRGHIKIGAK